MGFSGFSRDFRPGRYNSAVVAALIASPASRCPPTGCATEPPSGIFDPVAARGEHLAPAEEREYSKKEEWLREKALRPDFRISENELARAAKPPSKREAARQGGAREAAVGRRAGRPRTGRPSRPAHRAGDDVVQHLDARGAADPARADADVADPVPHVPARSLHQPGDAHGHAPDRRAHARRRQVLRRRGSTSCRATARPSTT